MPVDMHTEGIAHNRHYDINGFLLLLIYYYKARDLAWISLWISLQISCGSHFGFYCRFKNGFHYGFH